MIINLKAISHESRAYEFNLERDWWYSDKENDQIIALDTPLQVKIKIYKAGDKYVLDGSLSGRLLVRCDRCVEPYYQDLGTDFRVFLALPLPETDKSEIELFEEDLEVDFIRGEEIDLDEIIREQVYLSLPMKSLCRKDCRGLCPICGRNLNEGGCQCYRDEGHLGFRQLRHLKIQGE